LGRQNWRFKIIPGETNEDNRRKEQGRKGSRLKRHRNREDERGSGLRLTDQRE